jgi:Flagellar biosynthesis pathway, component FliQ
MNEMDVIQVLRDALTTAMVLSAPVFIVAAAVGLAIALFQALTSVQEMTLTYVPKMAAVIGTIMLGLPFLFQTLAGLMDRIVDHIVAL